MREVGSTRRAPQAVVAHLGAAAWQDVLYEPPEKLDAGERDAPERLRPIVTIPKRHVPVGDLLQATVADRDAEHIAAEVVKHLLPATRVLRMYDPRRPPVQRRERPPVSRKR